MIKIFIKDKKIVFVFILKCPLSYHFNDLTYDLTYVAKRTTKKLKGIVSYDYGIFLFDRY
jgi:hypothetical protein